MLPKFSSIFIINKHIHTHTHTHKDTDSGKPPFSKKYLCKWCIFQISKKFWDPMPACQCSPIQGYTVSVSTTGSNTLRKYRVVEPLKQWM